MSMFTKILQVSCLISSLLACKGPSRERSQHIPPQKLPISYTPMELDSLYEPLYRDSFILQEKHDEFRHPVEQQFPMEQRLAHNTWIRSLLGELKMILLSLFGILESPIPYASWIDIYTPSTLSFKHLPTP